MQPSSAFCRAQEAHHHALARAATLDNVRRVASTAAAAWAKEGLAAVLREDRKLRTRTFAEAQAPMSEPPSDDVRWLSENPDRGYADPA
jgi:hypothetical protein